MASSAFLTIKAPSEASMREKMSKFIAFAFPVTTAEEAKAKVAEVANRYHDARHVCWAYRLGADGSETMANDNGEPSGTAGRPILGAIRSADLSNIVIAVVRYFGGIKLGTSGLITAYKEAASLAIQSAEIIEDCELSKLSFTFPYQAVNSVMKITKSDPDITVLSTDFNNTCSLTLSIRTDRLDDLCRRLSDISGVSLPNL